MVAAVHQRAISSQKHAAPGVSVASAQAAALDPQVEQKRSAAAQTVAALDTVKAEEVKRNEFKAKLREAINKATPQPRTEAEAERVMNSGATQASSALRGELATECDAAAGPLKSATATEVQPGSQPAPPAAALRSEPVGPPPAPVSAAPVVPAPLPPERLDYSADRGPTEQVMAQNGVTKQQMEEANDPAFGPALAARSSAEQHEATAASRYRQAEGKVQDQSHASAAQALSKDLAGMHGVREQQIGKVVAQQLGTKAKDAQERQRITDTIAGIKDKTRTDVEAILKSMETEAGNIFEAGLKRAEQAYEDAFEEAKGGIGTWLATWGDDWKRHIEDSLAKARVEYLRQVDLAIDEVATFVEDKLKAAKQRVADGRKEVEKFVSGLDASVKQYGEDALQAVSADFDAMSSEIDERRDGLINKLTEQYKASYERVSAMEERLREENKSLWERVYDATVGLIKKIIEFKNMLLDVLGRAAAVIGDIIAHPIRFLGNLVAGVMQGLRNFMSKIGTYLLKGLMDWLFGALAGAGLQLPDKFDLQGIISIVLQILGLTYANFRARAVAIVGESVVAAIEKTAEVFKVIVTEGISGLWRFIKDQLANLKSMVLDAIFDFIKDRVIMAGITWIIGLLNPASAFFKACKAIYDIVMFFVNRGRQILALVNAVIDSMAAIARGAIGMAANFVENALAKAIPVAIGFLASLLGLGDPSKPVRGFIEKAQAPVNKAIDWVINLAVKAVKAVGKFVGRAAKAGVAAVSGWFGLRKRFNAQGESHDLYFTGKEANARLVVASKEREVEELLAKGGEFEQQIMDSGEPGKLKALSSARQAHLNVIKARDFLIKTPDDSVAFDLLKSSLETLGTHLGVLGVGLIVGKPLKEGDTVILIGHEGGRKRVWPIDVTSVTPGKNFEFEGHGGKGFSKLRGQFSFSSFGVSWRFKESDADLHIEEHHKIPWEHPAHIQHPLTQLSEVDLFSDGRNKMMLGGHRSRHSASYHRAITDMLNSAHRSLVQKTKTSANQAIGGVMAAIEKDIASGALRPYDDKDVWIP